MEKHLIKQSEQVAFGRYNFSNYQLNCLVAVVNQIQDKLELDIDWDEAGANIFRKYFPMNEKNMTLPVLVRLTGNIDDGGHRSKVLEDIKGLKKIDVEYTTITSDGKRLKTFLTPFSSIEYPEEDNLEVPIGCVRFQLSIQTLRWLLRYGKEVNLMTFDRRSILALSGKYSKRIFQIISAKYKEVIFEMPLDELKRILCAEHYKTYKDFKKRVLDTAQQEMCKNTACRLHFGYKAKITKDSSGTGRRRKVDTIMFKVYDRDSKTYNEEIEKDEKVMKGWTM